MTSPCLLVCLLVDPAPPWACALPTSTVDPATSPSEGLGAAARRPRRPRMLSCPSAVEPRHTTISLVPGTGCEQSLASPRLLSDGLHRRPKGGRVPRMTVCAMPGFARPPGMSQLIGVGSTRTRWPDLDAMPPGPGSLAHLTHRTLPSASTDHVRVRQEMLLICLARSAERKGAPQAPKSHVVGVRYPFPVRQFGWQKDCSRSISISTLNPGH